MSTDANTVAAATAAATTAAPPSLIAKIDALAAKLDAAAKAEEAKAVTTVKSFFTKHWPWMLGVLTAATRFLHL
jgi:hypothetical protein